MIVRIISGLVTPTRWAIDYALATVATVTTKSSTVVEMAVPIVVMNSVAPASVIGRIPPAFVDTAYCIPTDSVAPTMISDCPATFRAMQ
jgi:hypothetical protein